jgi:hypothetical protein
MNIHNCKTIQCFMKSVHHILRHEDRGSASCLHIYADKAMKETVIMVPVLQPKQKQ